MEAPSDQEILHDSRQAEDAIPDKNSPNHDKRYDSGNAEDDSLDMASSSPLEFGIPDEQLAIREDPDNYTPRELRPRDGPIKHTTWLDHDESGNYDPREEMRLQRMRTRPRPQRARPSCNQEKERVPIEKPKLIVAVSFKTSEGKKAFTDIDSHMKAQEAVDQTGYKLRARAQDNGLEIHFQGADVTGKPFARGCQACATLGSECSLVHDERQWPCQSCAEDDVPCHLIQPPVRKRACESCKRRRMPCSYSYTRNHGHCCTQCKQAGQECEAGPAPQYIRQRKRLDRDYELDLHPDQPSSKKKAKHRAFEDCFECTQAGRACEYNLNDDGSPCSDGSPCKACQATGEPCGIGQGPPPQAIPQSRGKKRKRPREDEAKTVEKEGVVATSEPTENESIEEEKRSEDLVPKQEQSTIQKEKPIVGPKVKEIPYSCNPHANAKKRQRNEPEPPRAPQTTQNLAIRLPPQQRVAQPQQPPPRPYRGQGIRRRITTNFCHPIQFNCDKRSSGQSTHDCHFCDESTRHIAVFGLGRARAEVIDWEDGSPYEELRGGHKSMGVENTRICTQCTTERLEILLCPSHVMVALPDTQYTDEELDHAMNELCKGNMLALHYYCALCANLAQYECQASEDGCGLRLCEGCAVTLEEDHESNLQDMLSRVNTEPTESAPIGLRADAELLNKRRGALMRFLRHMQGV